MTDTAPLTEILRPARGMFFDFDGPLCDVFERVPASKIAEDLSGTLTESHPELRDALSSEGDPMRVLDIAYTQGKDIGHTIDRQLATAELHAVREAGEPEPGAVEALRAAQEPLWRTTAIVSNNDHSCIELFLRVNRLQPLVQEIVGRFERRPDRMKPNPWPVVIAAKRLGVDVTKCVLIGDSVSDMEAAKAAGAKAIGYANKPGKHEALMQAGADAVIQHMGSIALALK